VPTVEVKPFYTSSIKTQYVPDTDLGLIEWGKQEVVRTNEIQPYIEVFSSLIVPESIEYAASRCAFDGIRTMPAAKVEGGYRRVEVISVEDHQHTIIYAFFNSRTFDSWLVLPELAEIIKGGD